MSIKLELTVWRFYPFNNIFLSLFYLFPPALERYMEQFLNANATFCQFRNHVLFLQKRAVFTERTKKHCKIAPHVSYCKDATLCFQKNFTNNSPIKSYSFWYSDYSICSIEHLNTVEVNRNKMISLPNWHLSIKVDFQTKRTKWTPNKTISMNRWEALWLLKILQLGETINSFE